MTNLPVIPGGQGLPADPAQMDDYYAQYAEAYAAEEKRAGTSIRIKNGMMYVGDDAIPGNQFAAIVLDAVRLNTFYGTSYDPQNITPPVCYAIHRDEGQMAPHPDMAKDQSWFQPQAERCIACPQNQFGTARQGRGKACGNRRRMLLLVAGTYQNGQIQPINDIEYYKTAQPLTLAIAPTSAPGWGEFVRKANADWHRPPFGVIARVYLYPHPKHGKEAVGFETLAPVPDEWAAVVYQRHQEAAQAIFEGYDPPERKQGQQAGGGFYGVAGPR